MSRPRRRLPRGIGRTRFRGIRFRLGLALALSLLPILILSAAQTDADFREENQARRTALELAAERTAAAARARLENTSIALDALSLEMGDPRCGERLEMMAQRLRIDQPVAIYSAGGQSTCETDPTPTNVAAEAWFDRLRQGEAEVLYRAPAHWSPTPSLIVARRIQRPLGRFDGAVVTLTPLSALQADVTDQALPEGAAAALTDADGRVLVASDPAAFDLAEGRTLNGWIDRARDGGDSAFLEKDRDGRRRVYTGAALVGRDVFVLLSAPDIGLMSWARLNPIGILLLPLFAWMVAFAAAMWMTERIVVRWLAYLRRIAVIFARGRFDVRPVQALRGPAEIRSLALALDNMADKIVKRDQSLTDSLEEKDALMREIHHRVKNNLQIISSLLSMQQRVLTDDAAKAALGDTRQRISALALIYRTLYQGDDIRHVDLRDFLGDLVGQLVVGEAMKGPLVTSSVIADSLIIDPDKLAPIALWVVEAVSNAHKHAFAGRGGTLSVVFAIEGDAGRLEVRDDGPSEHGAGESTGVGRTLMTAFGRQLRGESSLSPAPGGGTIATLRFPTSERPARKGT